MWRLPIGASDKHPPPSPHPFGQIATRTDILLKEQAASPFSKIRLIVQSRKSRIGDKHHRQDHTILSGVLSKINRWGSPLTGGKEHCQVRFHQNLSSSEFKSSKSSLQPESIRNSQVPPSPYEWRPAMHEEYHCPRAGISNREDYSMSKKFSRYQPE